ncbi:MAG: ABC transporter substrate-binding protein [Gammaproteobacteria bacterium]|nr:ABC transporter substrate-binding protein [Gammaproteobacteria bacterium]
MLKVKSLVPVLMAGLMGLEAGPVQAVPAAEEVVRTTTDQTVARLREQKADLQAHPEKIYDLIHELVIPHFDFPSISKWVLGSNWRAATDQQRDAFTAQFRTLLVRTYAKALLEYSDEDIRFLNAENSPESNVVVVKTEVDSPGGGAPTPIHYRMHISGGAWKVVDVSVDGVSLVSTYRGSFASEISKGGLDNLIAKLVDRNQKISLVSPKQAAGDAEHAYH